MTKFQRACYEVAWVSVAIMVAIAIIAAIGGG